MYTDSISTFLIFLQARVSKFRCRIFHCFVDLSKIWFHYHWFLSLKSYWLMIFLHLESFVNKAFRIRFLNISKSVFLRSNPPRKVNFFAQLGILFFEILAPFHIQETSESIRPFCQKNPTRVNNLKWSEWVSSF